LFSVLSAQSILSHAVAGAGPVTPDVGFRQACADALSDAGAVESRLFRIRAGTLLHGLAPDAAAATLSGLLIGAEIAAATRIMTLPRRAVVLVASGAMRDLYEAALSVAGFSADVVDADEAVRKGLAQAARHYGMLEAKGATA
jgi:2-dehydro-3-deoxygalactonokinase